MLTSKARKPKTRSENSTRCEVVRERVSLASCEDSTFNADILQPKNSNHLQLPLIYLTENLIKPSRNGCCFEERSEGKENQKWGMPKIFRSLRSTEERKHKESSLERMPTAQKERIAEGSKIYHNFINKRKNKMKSHMTKIIEKVISENIEPWELDHSRLRPTQHLRNKENQECPFELELLGWAKSGEDSESWNMWKC